MSRRTPYYLVTALLALAALALILGRGRFTGSAITEERFDAGRFGAIHLYRGDGSPRQLVLLISGDAGWRQDMSGMARTLAKPGVLVAGIDLNQYRNGVNGSGDYCDYPAGTLAALNRNLQQRYRIPEQRPPLLVGYAGGATLAYVALAQSPANTFLGAISIGFRPTLGLTKALCKGLGPLDWNWRKDGNGMDFLPAKSLAAPWIVLQADSDPSSGSRRVADFVKAVPQAKLIMFPSTADNATDAPAWRDPLAAAAEEFADAPPPSAESAAEALNDLPLVELPGAAVGGPGEYAAVIVSGDGGWADIDRDIASILTAQGIPVVGWDSLHYFWTRRTPDGVGQDLARVVTAQLNTWPGRRLLLIGYSLGADALPFMASRLPEKLKARVALVALLGISPSMDFEFRVADWLPGGQAPAPNPTGPEVARLASLKILCVYGEQENDSLCPRLNSDTVIVRRLPGGHHFDGDYARLTRIILDAARQPSSPKLKPPPT